MISDAEMRGRRLLQKWNTTSAPIRMAFSSIRKRLVFEAVGRLTLVSKDESRLEGEGFGVLVELRKAGFRNVCDEEFCRRSGLVIGKYAESLEIVLDSGDIVLLSAFRPELPS